MKNYKTIISYLIIITILTTIMLLTIDNINTTPIGPLNNKFIYVELDSVKLCGQILIALCLSFLVTIALQLGFTDQE